MIDTIDVVVSASVSAFINGMNQAQNALNSFAGSATAAQEASVTFSKMVGAAAIAIGAFGLASIKMAGDMEQTMVAFTTLLGSAKKAKEFLAEMADFAAHTPFTLIGLQKSSKQLLAFGFEAKSIIPMMTNIGDAVGALGGGEVEIARVVRALGQMNAKGKVSAEEMNQLAETGIPVWKLLAKNIGTDTKGAMAQVTKGTVDAATGISALLKGMADSFGGSMQAQSKTLLGMFSNLQDNVGQIMINFGAMLIDLLGIKSAIGGLIEFTGYLRELTKNVIELAEKTGSMSAAIKQMIPPQVLAMIFVVTGAIAGALVPAIGLAVMWIGRFVLALLPAIIKGAIFGYVAYLIATNWDKITAAVQGATAKLGGYFVPTLVAVIGGMTALALVLNGVSLKFALIAGAAAAFAALAYIVATNWSSISKVFQALPALIVAGFSAMYADAKRTMLGLVTVMYNAFNRMLDIIQPTIDRLGSFGGPLAAIANGFYAARRSVYSFGSGLSNALGSAEVSFSNAQMSIGNAQAVISQNWSALTNNVINQVKGIVSSVTGGISGLATPATNDYGNSLQKAADDAKKLGNTVTDTTGAIKEFSSATEIALTALDYFDHQIDILGKQLEIFRLQNGLATDSTIYLGKSIEVIGAQQRIAALKVNDLTNKLNALSKAGQTNTKEFLDTETALYDAKLQYENFGQAIKDASAKAKESNADWVAVTQHVSKLSKEIKGATKAAQSSNFSTIASEISSGSTAATRSMTTSTATSRIASVGVPTVISGDTGTAYPAMSAPTGTTTPNSVAGTQPEMTYSPVVVENVYVRKETDIAEIAKELFRLQQNQLRARGVTP